MADLVELGEVLAGERESRACDVLAQVRHRRGARDEQDVRRPLPVTVTYELTDLGLSPHQMMRGIKTWAETHMDDVLAHREAHDTRTT